MATELALGRLPLSPIPGSSAFPRGREKAARLGFTTTQHGESSSDVKVPISEKEKDRWPNTAVSVLRRPGSNGFSALGLGIQRLAA